MGRVQFWLQRRKRGRRLGNLLSELRYFWWRYVRGNRHDDLATTIYQRGFKNAMVGGSWALPYICDPTTSTSSNPRAKWRFKR